MSVKTSRIQNVNIVSTNYSRYGVSVYDRLYNGKGEGSRNSDVQRKQLPELTKSESMASDLDNDNATISTNNSRKSLIKRKYRSLFSASSKKLITKLYEHGSTTDSFSIFSHKAAPETQPEELDVDVVDSPLIEQKQFSDLPEEVLKVVLGNLKDDQVSLVNCLYVNKALYNAAKPVLYEKPNFSSTYRVAQFVTSIRITPQNGALVKVLDLSNLKNGVISEKSGNANVNNTPSTVADSPDIDISNVFTGRSRATSVTSTNSNPSIMTTNATNGGKEVAYAGWRDWRYRHDPLYSSPLLNSYNNKRNNSRPASVKSVSTSNSSTSLSLFPNLLSKDGNTGSSSESKNNDHPLSTFKRTRSNSSVSSITNSIMSSLYNGSHVSLNTTVSGSESAIPKTPTKTKLQTPPANAEDSDQSPASSIKEDDTSSFGMTNDKASGTATTWFRMKLRGTRTRGQRNKDKILEKELKAKLTNNGSSEKIKKEVTIKRVQPFSSPHPFANKFLLKYAPYKDLPLGYILHILDHCPHLTELNLSNLVLCSDFEIIEKVKRKRFNSSLLLPSVQESVISTDTSDNLAVVYLTDSNKSYDYYDRMSNVNKHRRNSSMNGFWNSPSWGDGPAPIGSNKNELKRTNSQSLIRSGVELRKLNASEIFQHIVQNHSADFATKLHVKIDNVLWCRQEIVKSFILQSFENEKESHKDDSNDLFENDLVFSFEKSGLNRNTAWTCKGDLKDFVTLVVLEEVNKMDDLELENVFNIKAERHLEAGSTTDKAPEIYDVSNIFNVEYGFQSDHKKVMKFRLTILKNDMPMSYAVRQMTNQYSSIIVDLQNNRNVAMPHPVTPNEEHEENEVMEGVFVADVPEDNNAPDPNAGINEPLTTDPRLRIERITQEIVARLKELRGSDLRRNIGENNYVREEFRI
ncbi:Uncharacterized protein RNJ44_00112 [Nakaseomyces bracarensis]|uniref:F-box domain-containing protein n=1 Tax=Nakaseomyces bracarensis TaxID=273131 RepID=A0ABR4P169_9SACH